MHWFDASRAKFAATAPAEKPAAGQFEITRKAVGPRLTTMPPF